MKLVCYDFIWHQTSIKCAEKTGIGLGRWFSLRHCLRQLWKTESVSTCLHHHHHHHSPPHTHAHTIHTKKGKKGIASIISTIEENKYSEVLFYALHYLSHLNGNYAGLVEPFHANANLLLSLKLTINIVLLWFTFPF